jgi:hypothetical protein
VEVLDFDGAFRVERDDELLARLRSVRRGADGAFILDHGGDGSLWVHINGTLRSSGSAPTGTAATRGSFWTACGLGIAAMFGFCWSAEMREIQSSCDGGSCCRSMPPTERLSSISTRHRRQRR